MPRRDLFAVDLDHLGLDVLGDQRVRRALGERPAVVDDLEVIAEPLGLVHEVRGEDDGLALAQQHAQLLPHLVARLRIEAGGRLVEEDEVGIVHQGAREHEASLHAAGELLDAAVGARFQRREFQQPRDARLHLRAAQPEIAPVDDQVLAHGEIRIEVVDLRHHAHPDATLPRGLGNRESQQADAARVRAREPEQHAKRGGLARAVGTQQPVALAARDLQVDARHHLAPAIPLANAARRKNGHRIQRETISRSTCSLRWKKCSPPGTTATVTSRGVAQARESESGTVSSRSP